MSEYKEVDLILRHVLGVDPSLGGDKSAACLIREIDHVTLRHFQDPLHQRSYQVIGTKALSGSLVSQSAQIEAIMSRFERCVVGIDITGMGVGIADILESNHVYPKRITITGGNHANHNGRKMNVPRTVLIETLQRVIQQGKIIVLKSQYSDLLLRELESFRSVYTSDGKLRFEIDISRSLSHADFSFGTAVGVYVLENSGEVQAVSLAGL